MIGPCGGTLSCLVVAQSYGRRGAASFVAAALIRTVNRHTALDISREQGRDTRGHLLRSCNVTRTDGCIITVTASRLSGRTCGRHLHRATGVPSDVPPPPDPVASGVLVNLHGHGATCRGERWGARGPVWVLTEDAIPP